MKNRVFILAMVLALVGAALLGTGFACAVQKEAAAAVLVEREQTVEILENSEVMPTPPPKEPQADDKTAVSIAQDAKIDADTALAMANHAAETLMDMQFPDDTIVEYIPSKDDVHFSTPAYWSVKDPAEEGGLYLQIDAATGNLLYMVGSPMIVGGLDDWGTATVEDGEAILKDPSVVLMEAEKRSRAFRPEETVKESWLFSVTRQEGYIHAHTMVSTDAATYGLDFIQLDGVFKVTDCSQWSGVVEKPDGKAEFYDNDADAWMWQLENFDDIKLVNVRKFEKGTPADGQLTEEEIKARCAEFFAMATETELSGMLVKYYKDLSGEREDYYVVTMHYGKDKVKLALSAETGDLLAWEGELPVQPILMHDARALWDWVWTDDCPEFDYALAWFEKTLKVLCGDALLESIMVNAVHDDYYMTLDATMSTGRIHEFGFEIKDGRAKLQYAEVYYGEEAFRNGYIVPWEADARVIDPNTGDIKLGWFGYEKLGAALLQ